MTNLFNSDHFASINVHGRINSAVASNTNLANFLPTYIVKLSNQRSIKLAFFLSTSNKQRREAVNSVSNGKKKNVAE